MKKLSLVLSTILVSFIGCGGGGGTTTTVAAPITPLQPLAPTVVKPTLQEIQTDVRAATVRIRVSGPDNQTWWGSGFLIDNDGHIVANNHTIVGASEIRVSLDGESRSISARPIAYAECADLAVIKLNSNTDTKPLAWYGADVYAGMEIASSGFPWSVTDGSREPIYTYKDGSVNTTSVQLYNWWSSVEAFYHSAQLSGGNSGGPAVELESGKVVGVNYAIGVNNQFHAISGTLAQMYVERMIQGENIHSIGISPRVELDINGRSIGVFVDAVTSGMLASNIGIKTGDQIYELGGSRLWDDGTLNEEGARRVQTLEKYCSILKTFNPNQGSVIKVELMRIALNGQRVSCVGEINGDSLTLSNNSAVRCPD